MGGSAREANGEERWTALAFRQLQHGDHAGARKSFHRAVEANPQSASAHANYGTACMHACDKGGAEVHYRRAVELQPTAAVMHLNLGILLRSQGRLEEAAAAFAEALRCDPCSAPALNNLGAIDLANGEVDAAILSLTRAVEADPHLPEAHCNLGDALNARGDNEVAMQHWRRALELRPGHAPALASVAQSLLKTDPTRAESVAREAISSSPRYAVSYVVLAGVLHELGRQGDAEDALRTALNLDPASAHARYALSQFLLRRGDYAEGFQLYESRFVAFAARYSTARALETRLGVGRRWRGEPIAGRRVLFWTEQGYGDSIMMLRYAPLLAARGASDVVLLCEEPLRRLAGAVVNIRLTATTHERDIGQFDVHCPVMSLPLCFGTTLADLPRHVPYIEPPNLESAAWALRLQDSRRLRVGVAWAGSAMLDKDAERSVPAQALSRLRTVPGVTWVSLQKERIGDSPDLPLLDAIAGCRDFLDTASLISQLDLVISVDSAVAHVAGAMAKPVWLLNRFDGDWRWGEQTSESVWYPTLRQFRQPSPGDWASVLDSIAMELDAVANASAELLANNQCNRGMRQT